MRGGESRRRMQETAFLRDFVETTTATRTRDEVDFYCKSGRRRREHEILVCKLTRCATRTWLMRETVLQRIHADRFVATCAFGMTSHKLSGDSFKRGTPQCRMSAGTWPL